MRTILRLATPLVLVGASLLGACRSHDDGAKGTRRDSAAGAAAGSLEQPARADTTGDTAGMRGMQGMKGGMKGGQMAGGMMGGMMGGMRDSMPAHMRMMQGMSADQMKAMLPAHRQMVANMLSQLEGDMRKMNMRPDAGWTALTDSIRQDLVRMPEMSASEMHGFMPAHGARVMRLMAMHQQMMGKR